MEIRVMEEAVPTVTIPHWMDARPTTTLLVVHHSEPAAAQRNTISSPNPPSPHLRLLHPSTHPRTQQCIGRFLSPSSPSIHAVGCHTSVPERIHRLGPFRCCTSESRPSFSSSFLYSSDSTFVSQSTLRWIVPGVLWPCIFSCWICPTLELFTSWSSIQNLFQHLPSDLALDLDRIGQPSPPTPHPFHSFNYPLCTILPIFHCVSILLHSRRRPLSLFFSSSNSPFSGAHGNHLMLYCHSSSIPIPIVKD